MPDYNFECYQEDGGCGELFTISCSMDKISELTPKCPNCKNKKAVARNFSGDIYIFDGSPKTVGSLADRNSKNMSEDQKHYLKEKHTSYKKPFTGSLPDGGRLRK